MTAGQSRGVPIAAVLSPSETLGSEHFRSVGALTTAAIAEGVDLTIPGARSSSTGCTGAMRAPHPRWATAKPAWISSQPERPPASDSSNANRPFDGMRILDLGVIVAGGELGRLFADLGAEVVKIESATYPDGLRQTPPGQVMSRSWALTHRNEYALGLDLRSPQGAESSPDWSQAPTRYSPTSSLEHLRPWAFRMKSCAS